ncbi:type II toxin-antitoxin system RelE/ParE family toxin [Terasakiella sp. A23]|uniref:type II toxin-antitoxin system RelE/ParE family toxin n=1 Tax=Terasakiella sp. FCG-A23 TaxID=3080561 RepID=UPI002953E565|nr:type II toxin-antitoxin system RelE/ParE family toxin [Terasakiella sp. A23]MDV7341309.1 type II toxin-antitoxin system RelE/ParE family toxin [Terasakiella sp. A23]
MIKNFGNKETEYLFESGKSRKIPSTILKVARRKLDMIDAAKELADLRIPPANRLEALVGDLIGFHSIRINKQWRVIFEWKEDGAHNVEIVDYH